jgi:hypothetical protein
MMTNLFTNLEEYRDQGQLGAILQSVHQFALNESPAQIQPQVQPLDDEFIYENH